MGGCTAADYYWSDDTGALYGAAGRFEPWTLTWTPAPRPVDAAALTAPQALLRLAGNRRLRRVPVGVIGPREANDMQRAIAEQLGAALARHGLQLLCGGKSGVMEAACKGHLEAGGLPIGLLPDAEWQQANPYVAIPIATGIGPARNAILTRAACALVAVGGGYGTLSEMAFGLQFGRPVFTLDATPQVDGARPCADVAAVMEALAAHILAPATGPEPAASKAS